MTNGSRIKRLERKYRGRVQAALKSIISSFIKDYKDWGQTYALAQIQPSKSLENALRDLYKFVVITEAADTLRETRKQVKAANMGFNAEWTRIVNGYLDRYLLDKAVNPITETTKQQILTVLKMGVENGWSVDQIVETLQNEELVKYRAERIVRTEVVRAANIGYMIGGLYSPYVQTKEWVAANDGRTRRTHKHGTGVDGEVRDLGQPFSNGLLFPGDPNAKPEETINCRCRIAMRAKRDANGRIIKNPLMENVQRTQVVDKFLMLLVRGLVQNAINSLG